MNLLRPLFGAVLPALALTLALPLTAGSLTGVKMKPASTRVGIAKVILMLDDLEIDGPRLGGSYAIKIPLAPRMNDRGEFLVESDILQRTLVTGGTLVGSGRSRLDGRTHPITCEFRSGGRVKITVETPQRVLSFKTEYEIFASDGP